MAPILQLTGLLLGSTLLAAFGQLMFKLGAAKLNVALISLDFPLRAITNPHILTGLIMYALSTLAWIGALTKAQLNFVYAFTALTLFFVFILSGTILGESMTELHLLGYFLVICGLILVFLGYRA